VHLSSLFNYTKYSTMVISASTSRILLVVAAGLSAVVSGFHVSQPALLVTSPARHSIRPVSILAFSRSHVHLRRLRMSDGDEQSGSSTTAPVASSTTTDSLDSLDDLDDETRKQLEKIRRSDELRAQEVFMKKSTGKHKCTNCDWEYDEAKGDVIMIGGQIQPGTAFAELPANWRCPVCRASKDSFVEVVEEIPGFAVNQGYGFGTNSWTAGQKNLAIFGGLAVFFILFLSGYALS
jgi:rubredoxin